MATEIYLGEPPAHIKEWILAHCEPKWLKFTLADGGEPGSVKRITLRCNDETLLQQQNIEYRVIPSGGQAGQWQQYPSGQEFTVVIDNVGDAVEIRGDNGAALAWGCAYWFELGTLDVRWRASGSLMTLFDKTGTLKTLDADYQFADMFNGCVQLLTPPELPAVNLRMTEKAYMNMFVNCYNMLETPELPATTIPESSYAYMFMNCTGLTAINNIKGNLTEQAAMGFLHGENTGGEPLTFDSLVRLDTPDLVDMYDGMLLAAPNIRYVDVSRSMTTEFVLSRAAKWPLHKGCTVNCKDGVVIIGQSGGGSSSSSEEGGAPLKFTAVTQGVLSLGASMAYEPTPVKFKTSRDSDWLDYVDDAVVALNVGDTVEFKAAADNIGFHRRFTFGSDDFPNSVFDVEGDITTLLRPDGGVLDLTPHAEASGFYGPFTSVFSSERPMSGIRNADGLILPPTTLSFLCYTGLFQDNQTLESAKFVLPAETLSNTNSVYSSMFYNCTSLKYGPDIMAKTWPSEEMLGWFMQMFYGCSSLESVRVNFDADTFIAGCMDTGSSYEWMYGVKPLGVFYATDPQFEAKLTAAGVARDANSVPQSWQISTWAPPSL